jgi:diguanylate cyclase (GGDEF)-like protein/PAS domain S-box-containing protein
VTAATDFGFGRMQQEARPRILLIEDDANDAELVQACLAEALRGGAQIVHAATLAQGLELLESQGIQITVLDLDLPDSVGFATLEKAAAAAGGPVIVVTGNPHPALLPEALKRGAYEVFRKSELDPRSLMRIVRLAALQSQTENALRLTERRYRSLIEDSREAIGLFGGRGELLYGNPAMRQLLWSGNNLIELAHPAERDSVREDYARLVTVPDGRVTIKAHFRYHDGGWRMLEAALRNRLQDGDVAAVVANFTDVTSQVELEERFRATFDQAAVGIAHVAHDGRFQLVNRKLCEILGYSREELAELTVFQVSHPEDRALTLALRRKMRAREIDSFCVVKRYLRKGGGPVWVELTVSLVRGADGTPSYEIALFEDISLRRQAEEALQRSERRFRALIENSADGILLTDVDGRMMYGSPGARRTLGYAGGETLGWPIADLVHPADREGFEAMTAAARAQAGRPQPLALRLRHKEGSYRLLQGTCTDLRAEESVRALVYNFEDATGREEASARARRMGSMYAALSAAGEAAGQLEDERELYRRICEIAVQLGGMTLAAVRLHDRESGLLDTVACAGEAASYAADAPISVDPALPHGRGLGGQAMRENRTTVSNDFAQEPCMRPWWEAGRRFGFAAVACIPLRRAGSPVGLLLLYSGDAGCFDAELIGLAERMAAGVSSALDRHDAERRVRDSEARFRSLANLSSDWYWEQDADLRFTWLSPGAALPGGQGGSALGLRRWEVPEYTPVSQTWEEHPAVLASLQRFRECEYLRCEPDGFRRYISISGEPVFDEAGGFTGYRGTARDITERKLSELRMARLKTMYEALSSANEAILRAKSAEEVLSRACEIAVGSGDFLLGTVFMLDAASGLLHRAAASGPRAGEAEALPASIRASDTGGQGLIGFACRTRRPAIANDYPSDARINHSRRALRNYAIGAAAVFPLVVEGELAGVFGLQHAERGAFTDELTALLQRLADNISFALENLQREGRYRTVVNSANEGILVYDRKLDIVAANAAAERILGVPEARLIGRPGFTSLFACVREDGAPLPEEERPARLTTRMGRGLTGYVVGIVREDRSVTWLSVNTAFLRRADDQDAYGVVSTISDITARRAAERALRESEERFRNLTELSTDWYWEQDEHLRFTRLDGGVFARIGVEPRRLLGRQRWDLAEVDAEAPEWRAHRQALEQREPFRDFEYSMLLPDGEWAHFSVSGHPVFDEAGTFCGYRGTGRDITARKRVQEELRRFRAALNASADSIFLVDADAMQIIDLNDAAAHSLGYEREELIGRHPAVLFESRDEAQVQAEYERAAASPQGTTLFRAHVRRKDGSLVPVEGSRRVLHAGGRNYVVGIARDITERLKSEERLQQSLERFEIVARATNDVVYDWNLDTDQLWWNENFRAVFGYEPSEVGAYVDSWFSRIHPDDLEFVKGDCRAAIAGGYKSWSGEYRFRRKDGSYAVVFDRGLVIRDSAGRPVRMIGAMLDVSARKEAERKIALHARRQEIIARLGQFALGQAGLDGVLEEAARGLHAGGCDVAAVVERLGSGAELLMRAACGEQAEACVGERAPVSPDATWAQLLGAAGAAAYEREHFAARDPRLPWSGWLRRLGSGICVPVRGESGAFGVLIMGSLRDDAFDAEDLSFAEAIAHVLSAAVRRHQTQTRLAYMAEFDALTGLPNRNLLHDRLTQSLAQASRHGWQGAVLFIDLDRFKLVNDTLGHHVGDRLIADVGRRIRECVRGGDTVGRVSGDEFGVVLTELAQADDAALVAQKILEALALPFDLGGNEAYVTASIGISVFPSDGGDAETLLKNADMAMYRAKELTRNAYCFFTGEMNQRSVAKLQLNTDLRRAIERREFVLHYQPKVDFAGGRIHGVEALLRWNHPQRGTVPPAEFIPALEDSGLILPVGEWVLEEAAAQVGAWRREGLQAVPVAVNLSAKQFRRRDLDALIRRTLSAAGIPASLIELEITESCLMEDPEDAVRLLGSLRRAGLGISVDDFGTGYSSLSYLTRLPLNALKIDRSFVRDAASRSEAASIVRAVIDMAHNLSFTVIAEGVETPEQVAFLRRHGCDLGQGYLFDPPMPAAQLAERLRRAA